jgi:hypothetical protein
MRGKAKRGIILHTVEHREYRVKARDLQEAFKVVKEANLGPKTRRVQLIDMGDFKITEEEL